MFVCGIKLDLSGGAIGLFRESPRKTKQQDFWKHPTRSIPLKISMLPPQEMLWNNCYLQTERAHKIAQMKLWAQKIANGTKTDLQSLAWPPENNLFPINQSFANWCMDLLMITKKVLRLVLVRFFWFDRMDWQGRVICLDLQFLMFVENSDSDLIIGTIGYGEDRTSYRSAHILSADQESETKICFGKLNWCWFKEEFHSFET